MAWEWRQGKHMSYLTIPEWEAEGIQIGFSSRWGGRKRFTLFLFEFRASCGR